MLLFRKGFRTKTQENTLRGIALIDIGQFATRIKLYFQFEKGTHGHETPRNRDQASSAEKPLTVSFTVGTSLCQPLRDAFDTIQNQQDIH